jgi:putative intracellular protease/amidase
MLSGLTQMLLGADQTTIKDYNAMTASPEFQKPLRWTSTDFNLNNFDLVYLPGGHGKGMSQILESPTVLKHLATYFPQTKKPSKKTIAAIGQSILPLARAKMADGKSVLHDATTTCLPDIFEDIAFWVTRPLLGDYYKTYGPGFTEVEREVKEALEDPDTQFKSSRLPGAWCVEGPKYNYISGRWPGDSRILAEETVKLVKMVLPEHTEMTLDALKKENTRG